MSNEQRSTVKPRFGIPDSIFNLYLDTGDGKPYYHSRPMKPEDTMLIRGVSVERVWKLEFNLEAIMLWYRTKRPHKIITDPFAVPAREQAA